MGRQEWRCDCGAFRGSPSSVPAHASRQAALCCVAPVSCGSFMRSGLDFWMASLGARWGGGDIQNLCLPCQSSEHVQCTSLGRCTDLQGLQRPMLLQAWLRKDCYMQVLQLQQRWHIPHPQPCWIPRRARVCRRLRSSPCRVAEHDARLLCSNRQSTEGVPAACRRCS